ncbi:hypothetical protein [Pacificoceanicola onchidii]|uniref:hypothetical protein n=1 Tax=Pacificoceanicola onchidii TaxID=2562685 RepID=UPI0010A3D7D6|nr:hypothetical protein [Pacificoceanicola onchidii]
MTPELEARLADLRQELDHSYGAAHETQLDHLEEVVLLLENKGDAVPAWAKERLAARIDERVEDQFDNMPF